MRTETKVIQVANSPREINAANASNALWGWSVMSVQITDRKTVYDGDTTGYVDELGVHATTQRITETVNYATITYVRDLDAPNAAELRRLENEYNNQTGMAVRYGMERSDEDYLSRWPEELAWHQDYQKKNRENRTYFWLLVRGALGVLLLIALVPVAMSQGWIPRNDSSLILALGLPTIGLIGIVAWKKYATLQAYLKDPQIPVRLEKIQQLIREAKAADKAQYDAAMARRAAIVKQAQELQTM